MPFQNAHGLPGRSKTRLCLRPRRGTILLSAKVSNRNRQIMICQSLRRHLRMIVMMPDIAKKKRVIRRRLELTGFFERQRALRSPPGIEMAAMAAAEPRAPPAAVYSLGGLVRLSVSVHREAVHQ